jgi:hypothetical protein
MEVAIVIASRVAEAAADPIEDLGSMWVTYSQMRRVCGNAIVGRAYHYGGCCCMGCSVGPRSGSTTMTTVPSSSLGLLASTT